MQASLSILLTPSPPSPEDRPGGVVGGAGVVGGDMAMRYAWENHLRCVQKVFRGNSAPKVELITPWMVARQSRQAWDCLAFESFRPNNGHKGHCTCLSPTKMRSIDKLHCQSWSQFGNWTPACFRAKRKKELCAYLSIKRYRWHLQKPSK